MIQGSASGPPGTSTIEAELLSPAASVQVWHFDLVDARHHVLREEDACRLDLSLSARLPGTRMCFADRWAAHRYERPGQIFLLPPGETLHVRSGIGRQGAIICHLPVERLREWLEADLEWSDRRLEASLDIAGTAIGHLLLQMGEEALHPGFASAVMSEALAMQIAVEVSRYYHGMGDRAAPGGLAAWRLRLIDERLRDLHEAPTLVELATLCRISVRQLSRGFRASRGISIGEHVARRRIENAKRLLAARESVKAVAYTMGFGSPSSFCFAFRKATGLTPTQYRDRIGALS